MFILHLHLFIFAFIFNPSMSNIKQFDNLTQIVDSLYLNFSKGCLKEEFLGLKSRKDVELTEVADLINFLAETSHRNWQLNDIFNILKEVFNKIVWVCVYEILLEVNKKVANIEYFTVLIEGWNILEEKNTVPYGLFFKKQEFLSENTTNTFYKNIMENKVSNVDLANNTYLTNIIPKEYFRNKQKKSFEFYSNFNCKEFFDAIVFNKELFELARQKSPEYLLFYMFSTYSTDKLTSNNFKDEYEKYLMNTTIATLKTFFEGTTNYFFIYVLFEKFSDKVLYLIAKLDLNLTKALDIFLEHKKLDLVLCTMKPSAFCYDIVVLCSRRDHLNLEFWVVNTLKDLDEFIGYFYEKVVETSKDKLFPFNKATINTIITALETRNEFDSSITHETRRKFTQLKTLAFDGVQAVDKTTLFLSEIIQNNIKFEEATEKLNNLICEDNALGKNIFMLLIDNYDGLYKWANSEMIACLFGELIKRKVCVNPFMKSAHDYLKKSLLSPNTDREFAFAFKVLEFFYNTEPDVFTDIESFENIRDNMVKKDMLILDEEIKEKMAFTTFIEELVQVEAKTSSLEKIKEQMRKEVLTTNKIMYTSRNNIAPENIKVSSLYSRNVIIYTIFYFLNSNANLFYDFVILQDKEFYKEFLQTSFLFLGKLETQSFVEEEAFVCNLGTFIGRLILANNREINLYMFDVSNYIIKNIEYRRISVCVGFITSFLTEGSNGKVYVPKNPWLMNLLDILTELHFCTVFKIREMIKRVFDVFKQPLVFPGEFTKIKSRLVTYNLHSIDEMKNIDHALLKKVVTIAMDFSTRETASKSISVICKTTQTIVKNVFTNTNDVEGINENMFRNIVVNVLRQNVRLHAFETLKASMYSTILHFTKLTALCLKEEQVYKLIAENVLICLAIIEKVAVTKAFEHMEIAEKEIKTESNENPFTAKIRRHKIISDIDNQIHTKEQQSKFVSKISLLKPYGFIEKRSLRKIENTEYQDLKTYLLQLGRKTPFKKHNFIFEEFPSLLKEDKYLHFKKMVEFLETKSTTKDEDCLSLARYLVGHALKTNCKDDFVFEFLYKIFAISNKTQKETVNWLIYNEDESKNIQLIAKFLEHNFIFVEEYDQALANLINKSPNNDFLDFALKLLEVLLLGDKIFCSIYNFIYTIEEISKKSEFNTASYSFLKKIEVKMLDFDTDGKDNIFDDFVNSLGFLQPTTNLYEKFFDFSEGKEIDFNAALKSCWAHFVIYNGNFRFFKIDILAQLIKSNSAVFIKTSLEILVQAYEKKMCLFYEFYCRFFTMWLKSEEGKTTYKTTVFKIIEILTPAQFSGFAAHFIEIVSAPFFDIYTKEENLWIVQQVMNVLKYNEKYEKLVYDFLKKKEVFVREYESQLIELCPEGCVSLKNYLDRNGKELALTGESEQEVRKVCLKVLNRFHAKNPTEAVKKAYEEMRKINKNYVFEYEKKYFSIS